MRLPLPPPGARAACLGRYSSDLQNPKSALDQLREAEDYCIRQKWVVVMREKDEDKTGRTTVGRTGFYNVIAAAEAGEIDVIVVEDISRMARDATDMMIAARKLNEAGVVLCITGKGPISGLELVLRAQIAQEESEAIGYRVKRGQRAAARDGRVVGGVAYGYELLTAPDEHGSKRAIDDNEADIVRRIYKDLAAGVSTHAICSALNGERIKPPSGKLWRPKAITGHPGTLNGIGRNPLYIGRLVYGKTNTQLIASTGKTTVTPGPISDQIVTEVPHLRILDDDLWLAVQDVLDERSTRLLDESGRAVPNRAKSPPYLFSGLLRCGECGHNYNMVSRQLGCEGRRQNAGCTNRRRVNRDELQDAVLTGLKERLLLPHLLDLYLDEYRREIDGAIAEQTNRAENLEARLKVIDSEIANLLQVAKAGSGAGGDFAVMYVHQELNNLGAQRKQLEREARTPAPTPISLETDAVIARLHDLLDNLNDALAGPERNAARARDIIRSFITRIEIRPMDGEKPDGRGIGPVHVTVHGSLTDLLQQASPNRMIQRRGGTFATLNHPTVVFKYYVEIADKETKTVGGRFADVAVFSQMLDDADAPVARAALVLALRDGPSLPTADQLKSLRLRADNAITHLIEAKRIRAIGEGPRKGWVWNDREISDEEWLRRAQNPPEPPLTFVRMAPPEAFVVVIGSPEEEE